MIAPEDGSFSYADVGSIVKVNNAPIFERLFWVTDCLDAFSITIRHFSWWDYAKSMFFHPSEYLVAFYSWA